MGSQSAWPDLKAGYRIQERLAGFPDLTMTIEDMFSAHNKL